MSRIITSMAVASLAASAAAVPAEARQAPSEWTGEKLSAACDGRDGWSDPAPPAHIYGNTWYVGTCGISAILITSDEGHVLIDSGPADAAPLVLANIQKLGFEPASVRWILTSHEHHDHVGGVAILQRATGARVAALASAKRALENGKPSADDPQAGQLPPFQPVTVSRVFADSDSMRLGQLTVHETPAHSPGSASWTWQACDVKFTCRMMAYADSATTVSAEGYRFADHPDRVARVRAGLSRIADLPCDILITPHPAASDLFARLSGKAALVDPDACRAYARSAEARFEQRLAGEAKGTSE